MNADNPQSLAPGTVLRGANTYTIVSVLGAGGFGITYLASTTFTQGNIRIKGFVAIKEHFISDHCERIPGSAQMSVAGTAKIHRLVEDSRKDFLAEARRLHQLGAGHDNIVRVNEVFEANGTAYYVMEYLDGRSLQQYIEANGPLDSEAIRSLLTPIVDAAAYLHKNRFTHLDIKPANIMLAEGADGGVRPVLIDFGLSKHYDEHGNATSTVNTCGASDGYAPVEQYQGISTFSPAADVYALGATMLACATGRRPSPSANWLPGEPAATIAALAVDPAIKAAMKRALNHAAHDRYPDAGALLAALGGRSATGNTYNIKKEPAGPATQVLTPSKGKRGAIIGAIAALAVLVAVGLAIFLRPSSEPQPEEAVADTLAVTQQAAVPIEQAQEAAAYFVEQQRLEQERLEQERREQERLEQERREQERLEQERLEQERQWWNARRTAKNLHLAVNRNGNYYYLSEADYNGLSSSQKSGLNKVGVVIIGNGERFILALNDLTSEALTWDEAMRRYGSQLPTKAQGYVLVSQNDAVETAVINFGGSKPDHWYWTKTECDTSNAWFVLMNNGGIYNRYKASTGRVRAVASVPVAAAAAI